MKTDFKKIFLITALVLLFGQGANQVFCGDIDCLQGGPSENCATLVCSILGSHTNLPGDPDAWGQDQGQDCQCICHLQFNHTRIDFWDLQLTLTGEVAVVPATYTVHLSHRIDHPPTS